MVILDISVSREYQLTLFSTFLRIAAGFKKRSTLYMNYTNKIILINSTVMLNIVDTGSDSKGNSSRITSFL